MKSNDCMLRKRNEENIRNLRLMSSKYRFITDILDQYSVTIDEWDNLIRDALFFTRNDVKYMYERTMQIVRRLKEQTGKFFEVKSSLGTF